MRIRMRAKRTLGAGIGLLLCGACLWAGDAAKPEAAPAADVLPADVVVYGITAPVDKVMDDIERFTRTVLDGLPFGAMNKDRIRGDIARLLNVPLDMLDGTAPLEIVVCAPGPKAPPRAGLLLHGKGAWDKLEALEKKGYTLQAPEKDIRILSHAALHRPPVHLLAVGEDTLVYGKTEADVRHIGKVAGELDGEALPARPADPILRLTVDIAKLMRIHGPNIDRGLSDLLEQIQSQGGAVNPVLAGLGKVIPVYLKDLRALGDQVKSMAAYLYLDDVRMQWSGFLTPKRETPFRAFVARYETADPAYEQAVYLPDKPAVAFCMYNDPEAGKVFRDWAARLVADVGAAMGKKMPEGMAEKVGALIGLSSGESCGAVVPAGGMLGQATVYYLKVSDAAAYTKAMAALVRQSQDFMAAFLEMMGMGALAGRLRIVYTDRAGEVEGVPYAEIRYEVEEAEGDAAAGGAQPMMQLMTATLEEQTQRMAVVDGTVVMAAGGDDATLLGEAVRSLKEKKVGFGKRTEAMAFMQAQEDKEFFVGACWLMDLVKMRLKTMGATVPGMERAMAQAMKTLPDSKHPVLASLGARDESLRFMLRVPGAAISETALGVFGLIQMMQQQMGGMQPQMPPAMPPSAPEGDTF